MSGIRRVNGGLLFGGGIITQFPLATPRPAPFPGIKVPVELPPLVFEFLINDLQLRLACLGEVDSINRVREGFGKPGILGKLSRKLELSNRLGKLRRIPIMG